MGINEEPAISVQGLVKSFGSIRALDGVDLEAAAGTVLGVLGPNGAGKTTTVRVLTTLLEPDAGSARVAGLDVVADAARLRTRIGLAGQYAAVDEHLTGEENLVMVGRLYGERRRVPTARARELLERFGLTDAADRLADRIAVIDRGHVIADGTADELKDRVGGERLEVHLSEPGHAIAAAEA